MRVRPSISAVDLHPADLVGGVQHLGARLGHEPQRRLGVAGLPRLRDHDDAEGFLVEHEGRDEVRLGHAGEPRARLDAALRGLGLRGPGGSRRSATRRRSRSRPCRSGTSVPTLTAAPSG